MMVKFLNFIMYLYKRNNWFFDLSRITNKFQKIKIKKPIFLLGLQGGGLTLVSRMLRRNKDVVSVTGGSDYWYGADEMQNVFWRILSIELAGIKYRCPGDFITPRGWLYASNRLIDDYRLTEDNVTDDLEDRLKKVIGYSLSRFSGSRFIDKSQVFTVKVSLISEILKGCDPKFILVTRNPYALCYRSVNKEGVVPELKMVVEKYGYKKALTMAAEHWNNSMKYALEDRNKIDSFLIVKLEDFLKKPRAGLKKICSFVEIDINEDMLPSPDNGPGLGTRSYPDKKWYPIRKDVNSGWLEKVSQEDVDIIHSVCGEMARVLGYQKP